MFDGMIMGMGSGDTEDMGKQITDAIRKRIKLHELGEEIGPELVKVIQEKYRYTNPDECHYCGTSEHVCTVHGVCGECHPLLIRDKADTLVDFVQYTVSEAILSFFSGDEVRALSLMAAILYPEEYMEFVVNEVAVERQKEIESEEIDIPSAFEDLDLGDVYGA